MFFSHKNIITKAKGHTATVSVNIGQAI